MLDKQKATEFAKRALRVHHNALRKPTEHTRVLAGHALELIAVTAGAAGYAIVFDVAGIAGAGILLYHIVTATEA